MFNTNPDQDITIDPNKNYVEELVGEGKKYATVEDMAKAILYKDQHIKRVETENSGMRKDFSDWREQHNAVQNLQEALTALKEQNHSSNDAPQVNEDTNKGQQIDMTQIESLFTNKIKEHEEFRKEETNEQMVLSKLKERYGDKYETYLRTQMDELGMSQEDVMEMARKRPSIFTKVFLSERQTENFQAPPQSNRRSDSFASTGAQKRDEAYYDKLRQEKPDVYWSPKIQNQMHEDAQRLGDAFFV